MAFLTNLAQQEKYEWLCYVRNGVGNYCKKKLIESPTARRGIIETEIINNRLKIFFILITHNS